MLIFFTCGLLFAVALIFPGELMSDAGGTELSLTEFRCLDQMVGGSGRRQNKAT